MLLPTLYVGDQMKIFRGFLIGSLLLLFGAGVLFGCAAADEGCKKVGGYFDANTLLEFSSDADHFYITILNEKFTLRRF